MYNTHILSEEIFDNLVIVHINKHSSKIILCLYKNQSFTKNDGGKDSVRIVKGQLRIRHF